MPVIGRSGGLTPARAVDTGGLGQWLVKDYQGEVFEVMADQAQVGESDLTFFISGEVVCVLQQWQWFRRAPTKSAEARPKS